MNKIIPRNEWVLIRPLAPEENKHGLVIPDMIEKEKRAHGTIVAVGSAVADLKKGDVVIHGMYAGESVNMQGEEYILIPHEEIIAFLK